MLTKPGRTRLRVLARGIAGATLALLLHPSVGQAQYLDPGAGSIIVQAVIAAIVGVGAIVRFYWGRISGFFTRRAGRSSK